MRLGQTLSRSILKVVLGTAILLLIPLTAMQFTDEVRWTLFDFVVAGGLLLGTGLIYMLISRHTANTIYRVATGLAIFSGLFLIWTNLAVGIIGSEDEQVNLIYWSVIAIGLAGIYISNLQIAGMARTTFVLAFAHILITVIALMAGWSELPGSSVLEIIMINGFFAVLFTLSGVLY
ncbi:MAG: hypothetical protein ACQETE_09690 [Bacteroidota bacterium]